jgi:CubicO group peptidase (beta-lactamase class C family)
MKRTLYLITFIVSFTSLFSQSPSFISDSLDSYIRQGMADWQVPALSIVIVKDGKVVFIKGYGVKDINSKEPVNENTLFMIASNTKLFTGLALAQLDYHKKISLDDKITKYFPNFKLYELSTTQLVTIRDLLSHRIGTKTFQGDFTFWNSKLSRNTIMEKMRLLKPSGNFRQQYGYCNSCFMTAGQIIPKVTNKEWNTYVKDSFFIPIGMTGTYASINDIPQENTLPKPYTTSYTGVLREVPLDKWDNLGPAASIVSNATDLSKWLLFQLDSGRVNGRQVVPFEALQKTRDINIILNSRRSSSAPTHMTGYGLGLFAADYNGRQVYWHTGGAAGMLSLVCFVPEEKLGFAVLSSNDNQNLFAVLRPQLLDAYMGLPYRNRSKLALPGFNQEMKKSLQEISDWKARVKGSSPALPLQAYTGTYTNPVYGSITVSLKDSGLMIKFNSHEDLTATLNYMDKGEWLMQYNNIEYGIFSVKFNISNKKVISIETKQNEFVEIDPYIFTKEK